MAKPCRGADLVLSALETANVENLFSLSGNQIMPLYDACNDSDLRLFHVRHEAAAVHMADAWGRLNGRPGVALVTAGPGFANALSALYVATMAESPLVLISGHAPHGQLGRGAFQEMSQAELAGQVAKASWMSSDASQLGHDVARAFRIASSGRPGPVHIAMPFDLLEAKVDKSTETAPQPDDFFPTMGLLDVRIAEEVLGLLASAKRPLILTGPASMQAEAFELLTALEETIHVPVVGMESPRGINDPSLGAFAEVLAEADLILLVGKKLNFTLKMGVAPAIAADCRFIQLDPEMSVFEQTGNVLDNPERLILTELVDTIPAIERLIQNAQKGDWHPNDWLEKVHSAITFRPADWSTLKTEADKPLHAAEVCCTVQEFLSQDDDAVFISDGGEFGQWTQAIVSAPHRVINGPSGSIGSVIPFALAARVSHPESRIVAMLGDGTFGFQPMEFDTAVRDNLPFIAVVGNDACWNAENQIQLRNYGPDRLIGCDLLPTRYDKIVEAMGGYGEFVTKADELAPALERAFESNLPACINVRIGRHAAPIIRTH